MPKRLTTEEFIAKASKKHNSYYSYSKTTYATTKVKVVITCPEHGDFLQAPSDHLSGRGCRKCANTSISNSRSGPDRHNKVTNDEFIARANEWHDGLYDYSKVSFDKVVDKVIIGCPVHGDFLQSVHKHLLGSGCQECAKRMPSSSYSYSGWGKAAETSKYFDSFKVYVVKCWNEKESFIKVGKTFRTIGKRFRSAGMPYQFVVLKVIVGDAVTISNLEHGIHRSNKHFKYTPDIVFDGRQECFTKVEIEGEVYGS